MAGTKRGMPFERTGPFPIDDKFVLSKAEMLAVDDLKMPEKYFAVNTDDGKFYLYDKSATPSAETGKFSVPEGGDAGHVELTQAEYDALTDEQKMDGTVYFITDGGAYVPAIELIPHSPQDPIVVGKFDLRGDGEYRNIYRVRRWISDLKNASPIITVGWTEQGVYVRPLRIYGYFTFHDYENTATGWRYIIQQFPIPYSGYAPIEAPSGEKIGLKFYVDHNNKLKMVAEGQSYFNQDDFASVVIDYIETPIT